MKVLLVLGPQPCFTYVASCLLEGLPVAAVVRQVYAAAPPYQGPARQEEVAAHARFEQEAAAARGRHYGPRALTLQLPASTEVVEVRADTLQEPGLERFVRQLAPEVLVTLGSSHVGQSVRRRVPHALNFHLGLTPRYRGDRGLFWPIYNMDPERLGVSILAIDDEIDGGPIAHHTRPPLEPQDSIHDMACKAVVAGVADLVRILRNLLEAAPLITTPPRGTGRIYYAAAYHPRHLQVIEQVMASPLLADYLANKKERDAHVVRVCYPGLD